MQGCLGVLDGTYIDVNVRARDKARYRTRKGSVASNVLAVCDRQLRFVYVLPGWEGSAADARLLRDTVNRVHGLRVPRGNYYLCDNGWTDDEKKTLAAALKELVVLGWKGDNGFRVGYLNKLEESMQRVFLNTDLKAQPHINSRVTTWKKNYGSLVTMLQRTCCSFNDQTKLIEIEDDLWDTIVNNDPNAKPMRYKHWKLFDDWKEIFGKDRATGKTAEDIMDAVNSMLHADNMEETGLADENPTFDDIPMGQQGENSCSQSARPADSGKVLGKKRKSFDGFADIYDLLAQLCTKTDERLEKLTQRLGYEYELGLAKQNVFEMLDKIPQLSIGQKFDVCEILAEKTEQLEIFLGLPAEARSQYVHRILGMGPNEDLTC